MKQIIIILLLLFSTITNAQIYKVKSYAFKENGKWSDWQDYDCFISVFTESDDIITVYGAPERTFYLIESKGLYLDDMLGTVFEYSAVDNNGKKCIVMLTVYSYTIGNKTKIKRALYIEYSNIMIAYDYSDTD